VSATRTQKPKDTIMIKSPGREPKALEVSSVKKQMATPSKSSDRNLLRKDYPSLEKLTGIDASDHRGIDVTDETISEKPSVKPGPLEIRERASEEVACATSSSYASYDLTRLKTATEVVLKTPISAGKSSRNDSFVVPVQRGTISPSGALYRSQPVPPSKSIQLCYHSMRVEPAIELVTRRGAPKTTRDMDTDWRVGSTFADKTEIQFSASASEADSRSGRSGPAAVAASTSKSVSKFASAYSIERENQMKKRLRAVFRKPMDRGDPIHFQNYLVERIAKGDGGET